ncbi:MAG: Holliday junction branch migration protein RuvA [Cytophagales bacterium]|nr:Holliday junction branch migration protein RuvA [Cytophagales bacterium]
MIGYLNGKLALKDPTFVILDVNGVGYEVRISLYTFSKIKDMESCTLHTYLHVKEDAQTLYGFFSREEKSIFLQLISINGVGPNTALMINSSLNVVELKNAIVNEEVSVIQKVKGIGNKTAHRIILELKDKIRKQGFEAGMQPIENIGIRSEALSALITLGIHKNIAEKSIDKILKQMGNDISLEELIKLVLKQS